MMEFALISLGLAMLLALASLASPSIEPSAGHYSRRSRSTDARVGRLGWIVRSLPNSAGIARIGSADVPVKSRSGAPFSAGDRIRIWAVDPGREIVAEIA